MASSGRILVIRCLSITGKIAASAAVATDQLAFRQSMEVEVESDRGPPQETEATEN